MGHHHGDMTLAAKEEMLRAHFKDVDPDDGVINRLFFAARNGAIVGICLDVEHYFADRGMKVHIKWKECSRYASLMTTLHDKEEHTRYHSLERDHHWPRTGAPSATAYSLKSITSGEYYRYRKPKAAERYDEILSSEEFRAFLENQILRANYPFGYVSYSSIG